MDETWLPVKGFDGRYEVSDHGRVRSLPRYVMVRGGGKRLVIPRILSPQTCCKRQDRLRVTLSHGVTKQQSHPLIHRLVAESFLGVVDGQPVRHLDGDEKNNRLDNLSADPLPPASKQVSGEVLAVREWR